MDLKHIVMLALQISILSTVFSFGLNATANDLLYLLRRPGLLARSIIAMFVVVPVLAVVLVLVFNFPRPVEMLLIALAISPVPPLLPQRELKAGGHAAYGLGLMAIMAVLDIAFIPLELEVLGRVFGRSLSISTNQIAGLVFKAAILPLLAGIVVRAFAPGIAARIEPAVGMFGKILLVVAGLGVLAGTYGAMWANVGGGTVVALVAFVVIGLVVGHVLGGPIPDESTVLALSTACRHPAIAFAIASANDPGQSFGPLVLLYLIINVIVALPYLVWRRKSMATAVAA